jgi:hypothetical protein
MVHTILFFADNEKGQQRILELTHASHQLGSARVRIVVRVGQAIADYLTPASPCDVISVTNDQNSVGCKCGERKKKWKLAPSCLYV